MGTRELSPGLCLQQFSHHTHCSSHLTLAWGIMRCENSLYTQVLVAAVDFGWGQAVHDFRFYMVSDGCRFKSYHFWSTSILARFKFARVGHMCQDANHDLPGNAIADSSLH